MLKKTASVVDFATKAFSGKALKRAKKFRKNIKRTHPSDVKMNRLAKKTVKATKDQQNFVRGTAAVGAGGTYLATKGKEDPIIPADY